LPFLGKNTRKLVSLAAKLDATHHTILIGIARFSER
jgi:hypothetical protein